MSDASTVARGLAEAFMAGPWDAVSLAARGRRALGLGSGATWLRELARRVVATDRPRNASDLAELVLADRGFRRARGQATLIVRRWLVAEPEMAPASGAPAGWEVPALA